MLSDLPISGLGLELIGGFELPPLFGGGIAIAGNQLEQDAALFAQRREVVVQLLKTNVLVSSWLRGDGVSFFAG